jgi:hypothetical protein
MFKNMDTVFALIGQAIEIRCARLFAPLVQRLDAIEHREPVKGPPGDPGINGIDGKDGRDGINGKDGRDGIDGRNGDNGINGTDGRDAFALDVLAEIDFTRSYARGTLAQHMGGLWRAHANTHGQDGWACVVEGVGAFTVEQVDERQFVITLQLSGGRTERTACSVPVMIWRGVWAAGRAYDQGDTVTRNGSLWHCNGHTEAMPETDAKAWTLAAKRGRDGKDAGSKS